MHTSGTPAHSLWIYSNLTFTQLSYSIRSVRVSSTLATRWPRPADLLWRGRSGWPLTVLTDPDRGWKLLKKTRLRGSPRRGTRRSADRAASVAYRGRGVHRSRPVEASHSVAGGASAARSRRV